jgi:glyceraldehyde 3-phosphate dehydrogenase
VDLVCEVSRETTIEEINSLFERESDKGRYEGIIRYTDDPIVSTDVNKSPYSAVFDSLLTMVTDGTLVKLVAWYDNEWGYSCRLVELVQKVSVPEPALT